MRDEDDSTDRLHAELRAATAQRLMSPAVRRRKLVMWCVRQALLCGGAWLWWEHTWMRWVFWIGVVFAVINLLLLLFAQRFLDAKAKRAEVRIDRLSEVIRANGSEGGDPDRSLPDR